MSNTPDNIIVAKIKEGKKSAFDTLFFRYYKPLYRFAFNICKSSSVAEESVQNTFIKIWNNRNNIPNDCEIIKLLFTYTKNEVIDEIRKQNTRRKYEGAVINEYITSTNDAPNNQEIVKAIIETAIEQLPQKAKEIFRLSKQEGLTNQEIAEYLQISKKTVENQLTNAYKKLKNNLQPYKNQLNF